jgi:hypothetical protein
VESLIDEPQLIGAITDIEEYTDEWEHFLRSARRSFPFLPLLVMIPGGGCLDDLVCHDRDADQQTTREYIASFFSRPRQPERRRHHRFGWPLQAELCGEPTTHRIREISAGGAFLEPHASIPEPGTRCDIRIEFQNFAISTTCEILDPRHTSSRVHAGFGVRFPELSEEARQFVDRIVTDALASILLDPNAAPEVPSIDEEQDVLSVGDEFSLTL